MSQSKDVNNQGKEDSFDTSGEIQSKFDLAVVVALVSLARSHGNPQGGANTLKSIQKHQKVSQNPK